MMSLVTAGKISFLWPEPAEAVSLETLKQKERENISSPCPM